MRCEYLLIITLIRDRKAIFSYELTMFSGDYESLWQFRQHDCLFINSVSVYVATDYMNPWVDFVY